MHNGALAQWCLLVYIFGDEPGPSNNDKSKKRVFRWRKAEPPQFHRDVVEDSFSPVPEDFAEWTPLRFFKQFWDDEIMDMVVTQTNLYSVQKSGSIINITKEEIEQFIGIQMLMSIVKLPQYEMYWSAETRYEPIASTLSLKRYKKLRQYLHVVDNNGREKEENKGDKCLKIKPLLQAVRKYCMKIEPEISHSIDEQIIPAKTKRSGSVRQYNLKKPHK